jgi:hypothetical protein
MIQRRKPRPFARTRVGVSQAVISLFFLDYCFLYVVVPPKAAGAARREPMGRWVGCPNDR